MNDPDGSRVPLSIIVKILGSILTGGMVLAITSLAQLDFIEGLMLSVLVGGIVLLVGILLDLAKTVSRTTEATAVHDRVEQAPVKYQAVMSLLAELGKVRPRASRELVELVEAELRRLGDLVRQMNGSDSTGHAIEAGVPQWYTMVYRGEDREWLLRLTSMAAKTIDAISLSTIDAGMNDYDGGLWRSDLGLRYLEAQRTACRRQVTVRRIFFFDKPEIPKDVGFREICITQMRAGIAVRILDLATLANLKHVDEREVCDFIVFDGKLTYETTTERTAGYGRRTETLTTYLSEVEERVQDLQGRFERFWELAHEPDWVLFQSRATPVVAAVAEEPPATV